MDREQALEWLVENVTEWPYIRTIHNDEWAWGCELGGGAVFVNFDTNERITKGDWLAATDNMKQRME